MLAELAVWLLTPAPWRFRRLGMVGDSVRLWSRGRRRSLHWAEHEQKCHAIVQQAVEGLQRHDTVVVLGSGIARDFPLAMLAARFRRVLLVDAVHILPVRLPILRFRNVSLLTRDLTGLTGWLAGVTDKREQPLADLAGQHGIDLVISANVLSQLSLPVEHWIEQRPKAANGLPADIGRHLVDWHLTDLASLDARICLLTDTHYRVLDKGGKTMADHDLLYGRTLPDPNASWEWPVAPRGEFRDGTAHLHSARGYVDFRAA